MCFHYHDCTANVLKGAPGFRFALAPVTVSLRQTIKKLMYKSTTMTNAPLCNNISYIHTSHLLIMITSTAPFKRTLVLV
jgi:hypothetical protein